MPGSSGGGAGRPPRTYRFRVTASNNSGVWNEAGASFDFSIAPAYYQTSWFFASCVAAFLAMLWGLYRYRLRQVAKEFNARMEGRVSERTRVARDLHDTLLQSFQGVLLKFSTVKYVMRSRPDEAEETFPQSPTRKALLRFTGTDWTLETCVEYDFRSRRNGRAAYVWLVHGDPAQRYDESIALVRSADLSEDSHRVGIAVYDRLTEPQWIELARTPAERYWLRITRKGDRVIVSWSDDGRSYRIELERSVRSESAAHSLVMNSSSFAGGASFLLKSVRLSGALPDLMPENVEHANILSDRCSPICGLTATVNSTPPAR